MTRNRHNLIRRLALLCVLATGCAHGELSLSGAPSASSYTRAADGSKASPTLGETRFSADVCASEDLRPEQQPLDADSFLAFLNAHGMRPVSIRARGDLVYIDAAGQSDKPVTFRVAILRSPGAAGRELHQALLQHGQGAWGIHRGNLAVLATSSSVDDIVAFAARTKLACWGVLTIAGLDDVFVVPGGYLEL